MTAIDQTTTDAASSTWIRVCRLDQLVPGRGVAARVAAHQVALFRWPAGDYPVVDDRNGSPPPDGRDPVGNDPVRDDRNSRIPPGNGDVVYAVDNRDPFSRAHVMSRGIVGDKSGVPKVASPIFKQNFDLRTGQCLDDEAVTLATYPVRVVDDGWIEVEAPS